MKHIAHLLTLCLAAVIVGLSGTQRADACSRIVYRGDSSLYIVGRSLDWRTPIPTNIYVYPRCIEKRSDDSPNAIRWTSKYGAVYAVSYDGGVTEGMNECGLVVNGLFCKGTVYNSPEDNGRPPMSLAVFVAWLLDNNSTTREVVEVLRRHDFEIGGATFDGGTVSALHWGVTDASGETAVFEFDHGKINIYQGDSLVALTNDPAWPDMQAIDRYWQSVGGMNMLPGTVRSADRYVRAHYFVTHVAATADADLGVSIARSVLYNVSVPYTYEIKGQPNLSSTQWRSYANLRDRRYYFDLVTNYGAYYIDLTTLNLGPGAPILKLDNTRTRSLVGNANAALVPSPGFTPMY